MCIGSTESPQGLCVSARPKKWPRSLVKIWPASTKSITLLLSAPHPSSQKQARCFSLLKSQWSSRYHRRTLVTTCTVITRCSTRGRWTRKLKCLLSQKAPRSTRCSKCGSTRARSTSCDSTARTPLTRLLLGTESTGTSTRKTCSAVVSNSPPSKNANCWSTRFCCTQRNFLFPRRPSSEATRSSRVSTQKHLLKCLLN